MDQQPADHRGLAEVRAIRGSAALPCRPDEAIVVVPPARRSPGVAEALRNGTSVAYLEAIADRLLCHSDVVALAGRDQRRDPDRQRPSDLVGLDRRPVDHAEPLALEQRTVDRALARRGTGVGLVDAQESLAKAVLALPDDQRAVVEHLGSSGHGVDVLTATAGSGKTYTLKTARQVWGGIRLSGHRRRLLPASCRRAPVGRGHPVVDVDAVVGTARPNSRLMEPNTVLVIDEAGWSAHASPLAGLTTPSGPAPRWFSSAIRSSSLRSMPAACSPHSPSGCPVRS